MARNNTKRKGAGRKTFGIIVDGETELWYLQMLRRNEDIAGITIKPDLPQKKKLSDQFKEVKSNAKIYDLSIWIVDLDVVIREEAIDKLGKYLAEAGAIDNIHILINTPCLEFWFLLHVEDTGKYYADGRSIEKELAKYESLKDYSKSEKYFVNKRLDIYKRLKPYLNTGITNALKRGSFDPSNPKQGKAEIYKLFEILGLHVS